MPRNHTPSASVPFIPAKIASHGFSLVPSRVVVRKVKPTCVLGALVEMEEISRRGMTIRAIAQRWGGRF